MNLHKPGSYLRALDSHILIFSTSQLLNVRCQNILNMEKTTDFRELIVWQKAHQFVLDVYSLTSRFPKEERFGITSQIRRASISIAANIAEGYSKRGP